MAGSLGSLVIELAASTARLQSDLGKAVGMAQSAAAKFSRVFQGVAVLAGAGSLGAVVARSIEMGDELNKAAIKAGTTGRAMSELAYAAKQSDIDLASLSTGIKKMQVALSEAASGGKAQNQVLAALGLTIAEIKSLAPDKQFELLADRINSLKDPADRARAATELFGKAGADLLPLFSQGAEGIRKAREEAQKIGASLSDEQIGKLAEADDSIKRLKASWEAFATRMVSFVAPAISAVFDTLSGVRAKESIEDLQNLLRGLDSNPNNSAAAQERNAILQRIELLKKEAIQKRLTAVSRGGGMVPGFKEPEKESKPAKQTDTAGMTEWVTRQREMTDALGDWVDAKVRDLELSNQYRDSLGDEADAMRTLGEVAQQGAEEASASLTKMAEDAAVAAQASQDAWADVFFAAMNGGIDDLARRWQQTLKWMVAQAAASGILSWFRGGSFLGAFTGTLGAGLDGIGKLFGGGMASGGPLEQGKWYIAGEKGPEPIWGGGAGAFAAGYGRGGGSPTINITTQIDARGATTDLVKALPGILKAHGEKVKSEIVDGLRRRAIEI